uniref:DH domain-containing protein n=1 Tax=Ascaris lumbricoides TaxID=6252 RepID=A0A9J2Q583_ASCLU
LQQDETEVQTIHPNREQLTRSLLRSKKNLQRATIAAQAFYADANEQPKTRSPWILKRLYEWSHRAKRREIIKHMQAALENSSDQEFDDEELEKLLDVTWDEMFITTDDLPIKDQKRLQAVWELFHSELIFLHKQLLVLRNVYKEPLKKCQVEGCLLTVEPDLLFGNLDQLCRISRGFCKSFLTIMHDVTKKQEQENKEATNNDDDVNVVSEHKEEAICDTTDLIVQLFQKFSKGPSTISAYQAYCINYKATMEYLGSIRQKEERFTEFERVCLTDPRCERLQLEDLLIAPLQRITRLPILLREIHRYTEGDDDKMRIEKVCLTDPRCERLQLEDLLIAPLQRITRLPILLREIHRYTEGDDDKMRIEKVCLTDPRCERLQLEDLLIAPLQRITRLPILLREIHRYTEGDDDKMRIEKVIETMNESLRSIDDSVQWLHNFERLQQLQTQVIWPSIMELEPRSFIPDFLRVALSRQFCENLLAHPRRKLIHEGHLEFFLRVALSRQFCENLLAHPRRKLIHEGHLEFKGSTQMTRTEHYVVQKQPVPLDSCVFCDADSNDSTTCMSLKFAFVIIHLTRYYQVVSIYTLQAANKRDK